jgi:hypothetical protein
LIFDLAPLVVLAARQATFFCFAAVNVQISSTWMRCALEGGNGFEGALRIGHPGLLTSR